MGLRKERLWSRAVRWVKTLFFLVTMLASLLLVCAPPLLVVILDLLLPPALALSASSDASFAAVGISSRLNSYTFHSSLLDVPLVSVARSLLILCVYLACEGRGPYLWITTVCGVGSIGFVSLKAATMFAAVTARGRRLLAVGGGRKDGAAIEALFLSSMALAMAHVVVAYRTSCRERRKLIVYRIDIEAVKLKGVKI